MYVILLKLIVNLKLQSFKIFDFNTYTNKDIILKLFSTRKIQTNVMNSKYIIEIGVSINYPRTFKYLDSI